MSRTGVVGISEDLAAARKKGLPADREYVFCDDSRRVDGLQEVDDVVFVVSEYNQVSTQLIVIVDAVDAILDKQRRWLWNLDGSEIHEVHVLLRGMQEGVPWE